MYMLWGYANGMFSVRGSTQSKQFAPGMAKVTSKSSNALQNDGSQQTHLPL